MDQTNLARNLIIHAGNAKSLAMEVISMAKKGQFDEADKKQKEATAAMHEAHNQQTEILRMSLENMDEGVTMLMAHAQDHMMNAITTMDMANEFVELYKIIYENRKELVS